MNKLLLVDGNSLINRAYYATNLTNGATYGFLNMLLRAVTDTGATHLAVAFDVRAKTFRHKMYDGYKAQRKGMPDDLAAQLVDLKSILQIMGVGCIEKEGYEADDIIGTVAKINADAGQCCTAILSADRDGMQLVHECTELYLTKTGVTHIEVYTPERIMKEYGLTPEQFIDLKALMGDKSDNIPGVMGVGEKTALELIKQYNTLESIYENIAEIKPNLAEKLTTHKDMAFLSRELAAIDCNVPIEFSADDFKFALPLGQQVFDAFKQRNFHSLCNRANLWKTGIVDNSNTQKTAGKSANKPTQLGFLEAVPATKKPVTTPARNATTPTQQVDIDLAPILIQMSKNGARIDLVTLQNLSDNYTLQINEISERIYKLAGEQFNINSPQQLGTILYQKLGIETTKKTKTGLSTNEAVLHKIEKMHPIIPEILRYRKVYKLHSTYVQGLKNCVDENGFVHSTFQSNTATGRLSSSEPNLQNIPIRGDSAQDIRSLFISRFEDGKILTADYSQIELRILAHLANDPIMIDAFKSGRDIHEETARQLGINRRTAKAVNFGITYGQTSFGLSESLGIPVGDAAKIIENYFARFSSIKKYLDSVRDFAVTYGYVETMFGRRRNIPELSSRNHNLVGFGMRAAMNMPMQGAASDIIKMAMMAIDKEMAARSMKSIMIIQIHDELVFDVHPDEIKILPDIVKNLMEDVTTLKAPLVVSMEMKETL